MNMNVTAIKTEVFHRGQDLLAFLETSLKGTALDGKVLAITSKIVSVDENQLVPLASISKADLVKREADVYLCEGAYGVELTIKHGMLIPSAGIDESNSESGDYILYPKMPFVSAEKIGRHLKSKFGLKELGIILTDSHSMPLRRGVTGISLAHWGFRAVSSLVGQPDIFAKPLKFTHVDVVDSFAAMAVLAMGEANERTPLAVIDSSKTEFTEESSEADICIRPENDLYHPLFARFLK